MEIRKLGAKSETTSKRGRYFFPSDFSYFSRKLPRQYTSNNLFSGNAQNICCKTYWFEEEFREQLKILRKLAPAQLVSLENGTLGRGKCYTSSCASQDKPSPSLYIYILKQFFIVFDNNLRGIMSSRLL